MYTQLTMPQIMQEAEAIARDAQSSFGDLNAEQLNWKPNADQWSVAQCLDHLISSTRQMFQAVDSAAIGAKQATFIERLPLLPGLFGKVLIKSVSPEATRKLKAPAASTPSASAIDPGIVRRFIAGQQEAIEKMKLIEARNLTGVVITSPFLGFVTYSLLDACRIVVAHERRHFAQAKRVIEMGHFPRP